MEPQNVISQGCSISLIIPVIASSLVVTLARLTIVIVIQFGSATLSIKFVFPS